MAAYPKALAKIWVAVDLTTSDFSATMMDCDITEICLSIPTS